MEVRCRRPLTFGPNPHKKQEYGMNIAQILVGLLMDQPLSPEPRPSRNPETSNPLNLFVHQFKGTIAWDSLILTQGRLQDRGCSPKH
jgi:hypothetical protein